MGNVDEDNWWWPCPRKTSFNGNNSGQNGKLLQHKLWLLFILPCAMGLAKNEIEQLKSCGPKALCMSGGYTNLDNKRSAQNGSNYSLCYCDSNCSQFGDCCLDKVSHLMKKAPSHSLSCVQLSSNQSVYAVSSCPSSGPLKQSCEKKIVWKEYHYMIDVPVYSNQTGLYYANIYCAHCHSQLSTVGHPLLSIKCTPNITIEMLSKFGLYQKGELMWKVMNGTCILINNGIVENARLCVRSVSDCPNNADPKHSAKCRAYSLISSDSEKTYRNPHCAFCNGVKECELTCGPVRNVGTLEDFLTVSAFKWKYDKCQVLGSVWDELQNKCEPLACGGDLNCLNVNCNYSDPNDLTCQIIYKLLTKKVDRYIMRICLSLSAFCLLLHMVISIFCQQSKNVPSKMIDSLAISSLISQIVCFLAINPLIVFPVVICYCLAISIQFFCLASFLWMNVLSIDVCCTFSNSSLDYTGVRKYSIYAIYVWSVAGLITAFSVTAEFTDIIPYSYRPHYASRPTICFFGSRNGVIAFFYFPITLIVLLNTALFTITVIWFQKQRKHSETLETSKNIAYNRVWLYIKLSTIMGASWMFGFFKILTNNMIYGYLFTAFTGLQGVFIFIMFDLKKENKIVLGFRGREKRRSTISYDQVSISISRRK